MNDLDRARQKRIRMAEHAEGALVIETAEVIVNSLLSSGLEDGMKMTAAMVALLALVDANGFDRSAVVEAAKLAVVQFPEIELVPA